MTRQITAAGLDLIKSFEELRQTGYLPTLNDRPTAGWGHTGPEVHVGATYTLDVCEQWLIDDTQSAADEVERDITVALTDDEFDALVCLTFNIGRGAFRNSTLRKKLDAGDHKGAAQEFLRWNKQAGRELAGLDRRRAAEMALFLKPEKGAKTMPSSPQNTGAFLGVGAAVLDLINWWYSGHPFPMPDDVKAASVVVGGYAAHAIHQSLGQIVQAVLARFPAKDAGSSPPAGQPG